MEFLELPEEYQALIGPDATRQVEEIRFWQQIDSLSLHFAAALWPSAESVSGLSSKPQHIVCANPDTNPVFFESTFRNNWFIPGPAPKQLTEEDKKGLQYSIQGRELYRRVSSEDYWKLHWGQSPFHGHLMINQKRVWIEDDFLESAENFFQLTDQEVIRYIERQLLNPQSGFSQALMWQDKPLAEQEAIYFLVEVGDSRDFVLLHGHLARITYNLMRDDLLGDFGWCWNLSKNPFDTELGQVLRLPPPDIEAWHDCFSLWRQVIQKAFRPVHIWNSQTAFYIAQTESPLCAIEFEDAPTAHELLEAQVFLSDWARKNAPELADKLLDFPA